MAPKGCFFSFVPKAHFFLPCSEHAFAPSVFSFHTHRCLCSQSAFYLFMPRACLCSQNVPWRLEGSFFFFTCILFFHPPKHAFAPIAHLFSLMNRACFFSFAPRALFFPFMLRACLCTQSAIFLFHAYDMPLHPKRVSFPYAQSAFFPFTPKACFCIHSILPFYAQSMSLHPERVSSLSRPEHISLPLPSESVFPFHAYRMPFHLWRISSFHA